MFKRALTLMMIVAAVGAAGLLSPGPVDATGHSATRSFSAASVIMGGTVDVTIAVEELGTVGEVKETLPEGFSYVSSSLSDSQVTTDGQVVTFTLFGEESFTYTVSAPDTVGEHTFSGVATNFDKDSNEVGGDSDVSVVASGVEAARSFSASTIDAGGELRVTITASEYGQFGQVVETLPAGFGYVSTSLDDPPWISGQMLGFSLFGEESFTYTVTVSRTLGSHDFSGVVKDDVRMEAAVGGDSTVTVQAATASHSATRSLDSRVEAGAEVVVTIDLEGLGGFGQVKETLPEGFAYVSSSLPDDQVESADGTLTFTILSEDSFTYTVTASDAGGRHALSGEAVNDARASASIGGAGSIAVGSTVVTSDGGNVMLTVTPDAQSVYFKGRIIEGCEGGPAEAEVALCATGRRVGRPGRRDSGLLPRRPLGADPHADRGAGDGAGRVRDAHRAARGRRGDGVREGRLRRRVDASRRRGRIRRGRKRHPQHLDHRLRRRVGDARQGAAAGHRRHDRPELADAGHRLHRRSDDTRRHPGPPPKEGRGLAATSPERGAQESTRGGAHQRPSPLFPLLLSLTPPLLPLPPSPVPDSVSPAKAGVQYARSVDSRVRGNDG